MPQLEEIQGLGSALSVHIWSAVTHRPHSHTQASFLLQFGLQVVWGDCPTENFSLMLSFSFFKQLLPSPRVRHRERLRGEREDVKRWRGQWITAERRPWCWTFGLPVKCGRVRTENKRSPFDMVVWSDLLQACRGLNQRGQGGGQ